MSPFKPAQTAGSSAFWLGKTFEGLRLKVERDMLTHGRLDTIGYGHTRGTGTWPGDEITPAAALSVLYWDLVEVSRQIRTVLHVPVTQGQFDALADFTFNLGLGHLEGSTLLRRMNAGDFLAASREFGKFIYSAGVVRPGLVRRRAAETVVFCSMGFPGGMVRSV
jgi:lysozyme